MASSNTINGIINHENEELSLDEFIKLPSTVDFLAVNGTHFADYVKDKLYIKLGTVLVAGNYVVAYTNKDNMNKIYQELGVDFVDIYPGILSLLDSDSNYDAGITKLEEQPYIHLDGSGVLIGFIDTGIDYMQDAFKYEDGTTKIKYIWDQTINGNPPENIRYGSVYNEEQINEALRSDSPLSVVPSVDTSGHGTFLASVASSRLKDGYEGAAQGSEIIAVKLRKASQYNIDKYYLPNLTEHLYESSDFILGIRFIIDKAGELNMPVVICIAMGANFDRHDGTTIFEEYISNISMRAGTVCIVAAGNESNAKHHTNGRLARTGDSVKISISVGENASTFPAFIWSAAYDKLSVSITTPLGETTSRIPFYPGHEYEKKLTLEKSTISVNYFKNSTTFLVGITDPTPGVWTLTLFGDSIVSGEYHAWLPIKGVISPNIEFMSPTPDTTITIPATAARVITTGAYNGHDESLYVASSWGPSRSLRILPDFVAPGVNVRGIYPSGTGTMSGTSVSAAVTSGAAALLLQWGIVQNNEPGMDSERVRTLMISGCRRDENIQYPNIQWGFGKLNLYGTFDFLRET